jgi:hypothetical protein
MSLSEQSSSARPWQALTNFRYGRGAGVGRGPGGGGGTTMTAPVIPEEQCAKQK